MSTRASIIQLTDELVRRKGYNAFSFKDISLAIGIKTASIHYYFPTKSDLGVALIQEHGIRLGMLKDRLQHKSPTEKFQGFLSIYTQIQEEGNICLVGALATDFNTFDTRIQTALQEFAQEIILWVTDILEEGKSTNEFSFQCPPRTKAIMIISNLLASVQLIRLTTPDDFNTITETILQELKPLKK